MDQCARLFAAEKLYAFQPPDRPQVIIAADVWLNPYRDQVHLCANPIAMQRFPLEFILEGTSRGGIHPDLVVKQRILYHFPSDLTPESVIIYTRGIDAVARNEVKLGAPPPPLAAAAAPAAAAATATPAPSAAAQPARPTEVIGHSINFSFEEALHDAMSQAEKLFPAPQTRHPDVAIAIEVQKIYASVGGNMLPGLFLKTLAKP